VAKKLSEYDENYFSNLTVGGILLRFVFGAVALVLIFGLIALGLGWFKAGSDIISPKNVKNQYEFAYSYNETLKGIAQNVCNAEQAVKDETDPAAKTERRSQLLAQQSLYQTREREYDAALENAFKAKYVKPGDVPNRAPTLAEEKTAVGC
jgi:hypothetical protein